MSPVSGERYSFNTQPLEGGWESNGVKKAESDGFNTQPLEGGWESNGLKKADSDGFNTQPLEGGWLPCSGRQRSFL